MGKTMLFLLLLLLLLTCIFAFPPFFFLLQDQHRVSSFDMSDIHQGSTSNPSADSSARRITDAFDVSAIVTELASQGITVDQDQLGAACATQLAQVTAAIEGRTSLQIEMDTSLVASLHSGSSQKSISSSHLGSTSRAAGNNVTTRSKKGQARSPSVKHLSSLQRLESGLEWQAKARSLQEISLARRTLQSMIWNHLWFQFAFAYVVWKVFSPQHLLVS